MNIISPNSRIRYPALLKIGNHSIIDDFCYISVALDVGEFFHIASHCAIVGGKESMFIGGNFGGLAPGVKVLCGSDDYKNDIVTTLPAEFAHVKNHLTKGIVTFGDYVTVGTNSVVFPNVTIPEGTVIGACSMVRSNVRLEPWSVYFGCPKLKLIGRRNKANVLRQVEQIRSLQHE